MAYNDSYDRNPNGPEREAPYGFTGRGDPRSTPERPRYARPTYPEPSGYSGGKDYGSRDPRGADYDARAYGGQTGRYDDYARGYADPLTGQTYAPYGSRAAQPAYGDPYADPYGYDEGGFDAFDAPAPEPEPERPRGYAFKVRNLTKDYDGNVVLHNISFDIPAGKIVGLLGPNGCGKTTLIKILAGLIHDYTGMIKIGGRPVGIASKASVAYLPDRTYFPERFRTIDCIDYFADFFKDFDKIKAIEFASRFGLDLHQRVKTMSKGMQEKLQLLVVMSRAADIYLLDEPLGGVDPAARGVILDIIMNNYKKNATVVLSTHQVNDLEHSFDHVLMLGHGQVLVNTGIETLRATGKSVEDIFKEVIGDAWEVE